MAAERTVHDLNHVVVRVVAGNGFDSGDEPRCLLMAAFREMDFIADP